MEDWDISDHNVIVIVVDVTNGISEECMVNQYNRWSCKNVDWEEYINELRRSA